MGGVKTDKVTPRYQDFCIANIPATILDLFGIRVSDSLSRRIPALKEFKKNPRLKVVLFVIDGLGYHEWLRLKKESTFWKKLSTRNDYSPFTSVFPSTTAAAITTLQTGLKPEEHALFEWYLYVKELDQVIFSLPFAPLHKNKRDYLLKIGVSPSILLPPRISNRNIYTKLRNASVSSFCFQHEDYAKSAYSKLVFKGITKYFPYKNARELFGKLYRQLEKTFGRGYFYIYWGEIDAALHKYGSKSKIYKERARTFFNYFQKFLEKLKKDKEARDIVILITADHGHIDVEPSKTIYLNKYKWLVESFNEGPRGNPIPPSGSARDVFLHIKSSQLEGIVIKLSKLLGQKADVFLIKAMFNKPSKKFMERAGNLLILPRRNHLVWYEHIPGVKFKFKSHHGGLSKEEMLVPFAIIKPHDFT